MHTFIAPSGARFHYNGDESGELWFSNPFVSDLIGVGEDGPRFSAHVEIADLRAFIAHLDGLAAIYAAEDAMSRKG